VTYPSALAPVRAVLRRGSESAKFFPDARRFSDDRDHRKMGHTIMGHATDGLFGEVHGGQSAEPITYFTHHQHLTDIAQAALEDAVTMARLA
jgi:hypothetical protein